MAGPLQLLLQPRAAGVIRECAPVGHREQGDAEGQS